ncbi:MAG TPA: cytochrome c nitrite reductase small subunit [Candidatus Angelobacter sp.]|nr:cytochrome c nitrite reductase small subunit [Candidatus Angelobacter sp.]
MARSKSPMRPANLKFVLFILMGVVAGIGGYAFVYAKGYSYLLNDPSACANCHAMRTQYDAWIKSSHHSAATCNDCHTPHNLIGKYAVKASNGFFHSFYFTTGKYPDNIQITRFDRGVTEAACRHCHQDITEAIDATNVHGRAEGIQCTRCHYSVGHLEAAASLTTAD